MNDEIKLTNECSQCGDTIPQVDAITGEERCYHRCVSCGHPHMGFFDVDLTPHQIPTDYRCIHCKDPFIFSHSILSDFMSCPKYAMFSIDLGRSRGSTAMDFGAAIHVALDALQKHRNLPEALMIFRDDYGIPPEWETLRTVERGEGILRAFWHKFQDNPLLTSPGVNEESAAIELAPGLLYSARIDRIPQVDGKRSIMDYKTTTYFDREEFTKTFNMSHQFTGYTYVASVISDTPIHDVDVLLIKVHRGTKTRKASELANGGTPYDDAYDFVILPQTRPDHMVERFIHTVKYYVKWWSECRATGFWPENTSYCFHYQRACQYLEYCQMPTDKAIKLLEFEFDLRHWDSIRGQETILASAKGAPRV